MWKSYYLWAPNEAAAKAAALACGRRLISAAGHWVVASNHHAFDPGVSVIATPAQYDSDGNLVTSTVYAEGWFANLRLREGDEVEGLLSLAAGEYDVRLLSEEEAGRHFA